MISLSQDGLSLLVDCFLFRIGLMTLVGASLFFFGLILGVCMEGSMWRSKGDHEYMNVKESSGRLYNVRKIKEGAA